MKPVTITLGDRTFVVHAQKTPDDHLVVVLPDGRRLVGAATREGQRTWVTLGGRTLVLQEARPGARKKDDHGGSLEAPMPGKVVKVLVQPGDIVEKGQVLLAVEAMKMEHALKAPRRARVKLVRAGPGEQVVPGAPLVELVDAPEDGEVGVTEAG